MPWANLDGKCPKCSPIDDHAFEPAVVDRKRGPEQMRQIVTAAKGELAPPPTPTTHDPHTDVRGADEEMSNG